MGAALLLIEIQELAAHCQELGAGLLRLDALLDSIIGELLEAA